MRKKQFSESYKHNAAENLNRKAHGFEIKKDFFNAATKWIDENRRRMQEIKELGYAKTEIENQYPSLFQ